MFIDDLVMNARQAMQEIENYTQEQVDEMLKAMSDIIIEHKESLAIMAVEETGLGRVDHKIGKNFNMATNIYAHLKGKKSVGVIRELKEQGLVEIAQPVGVIGSVTPTTNPVITPMGNSLMALKGRNAIIVSPHPRSLKTSTKTINLLRQALKGVNAPQDLVQIIDTPSVENSQKLMKTVDLVIATGGPGMVLAAYSSSTPAYGVGPGNVQLIMDDDFDCDEAANLAVIGRGFDNGIVCACTQAIIYPKAKETALFEAFTKHHAHVVEDDKTVETYRQLLFPQGKTNPSLIGVNSDIISNQAGEPISNQTEIIVLKSNAYGANELLAKEKMFPVLLAVPYETFDEAIEIAKANLCVEGKGHSVGILTHNPDHAVEVGLKLPVCRVVVNQPTIDAGGSPANGLNPTVSLGCGTWGNNIISENLTYKHLLNITRVSTPIE